jgi:endonuclease YncB( thermonuclease family)
MNKTEFAWKSLLIASLICTSSLAAEPSKPVKAVVTHVIDGDTVAIEAKWIPLPMKPEIAVRVYGVDTPEKSFRAKCETEAAMGAKASEFTKDLIAKAKAIEVSYYSWDKYGGRVLGDLLLDKKSLRASLINNGFAREYFGDAKQSWCE